MDPQQQLKEHLLQTLSLRVGDEMAEYIHRRMTTAFAAPIRIMARNARTGAPCALDLDPADLPPPGDAPATLRNAST